MGNELRAEMFTLRTHCKGIRGSGVIIKLDPHSQWAYVATAKHCILGDNFDNEALVSDISFSEIYGSNEKIIDCTVEETFIPAQNHDLALIRIARGRLLHIFDQLPVIKLATMTRNSGVLNFKGYPKYASGGSQTISGERPADDDNDSLFEIKVNDKFVDAFGADSEQSNVKGFSGSGIYQILDGSVYYFGVIHDYRAVGNRFVATDSIALRDLIGEDIPLYEPWVERILSENKLNEMLALSSKHLGARFDSEDNYPVSLEKEFGSIARSDGYADEIHANAQAVKTHLDNLHVNMSNDVSQFLFEFGTRRLTPKDHKEIKRQVAVNTLFQNAKAQSSFFISYFQSLDFSSSDNIGLKEVISKIEEMSSRYLMLATFIQNKIKWTPLGDQRKQSRKRLIQSDLQRSANALNDLKERLLDIEKYISCKLVLINGKGGNGKSQLLAHMANRWRIDGYTVVLALGQRFTSSTDPFGQFLSQLNIDSDWATFLRAMQAKSKSTGRISFIVIDALNEGKGLSLWSENLLAFLSTIEQYPGICVIISYRDSFKTGLFKGMILPVHLSLRHDGFLGKEKEAMEVFFNRSGIDISKVPVNKEFANPLYLKLFCIAFGNGALVEGLSTTESIFIIIERVVLHVNEILGTEDKYNYKSEKINLVDKAIASFVAKLVELGEAELPYEDAFLLIDAAVGMFLDRKGFVNGLLDEEILYDNLATDGKTYLLDFAYQRFGEHLRSLQMLGKMNLSEIKDSFLPNGELFKVLNPGENAVPDAGLIEAMTVQIKDRFGVELLEVAPALGEESDTVSAFVMGIVQNSSSEMASQATVEFVLNSIKEDIDLGRRIWVDLLMRSDALGSFSAEFLHRYLNEFSMAERDASWTIFINGEFRESLDGGLMSSLLVRALNAAHHPEQLDEVIWLNGLTLAWLLCSSNRALRDQTTKVMIILFMGKPHLLVRLIDKFQDVNDPYILQRIYAVVYGVVVKSPPSDSLTALANAVFKLIFSSPEVYPDVLLRDYARGTIVHCIKIGITFDFDDEKIAPPYKSKSLSTFPTNEEIDSYPIRYGTLDNTMGLTGSSMLLSSMVTEYGRGVAQYGDFGRYTFGSALRNWKGPKDNSLSNLAIKIIFEDFGYREKLHGWYDARYSGGRTRRDSHVERIGKKYQWIAFYQILARVSDNNEFTDRYAFNNESKVKYHGPWNPFVRDIDPSLVRSFKEREEGPEWLRNIDFGDWSGDDTLWFNSKTNIPDFSTLMKKTDSKNVEWLILNGNPEWNQPNDDPKVISRRLSYHIRSFICSEKDYPKVLKRLLLLDTWDENIHQVPSDYAVLNREYFSSIAYSDSGLEKEEVIDGQRFFNENSDSRSFLSDDIAVTSTVYNWEAETDHSMERNITFLKPSNTLYKLMELKHGVVDGEYEDSNGRVIATDPSLIYDLEPSLLIRKDEFFKMLKMKGKRVIFAIYGQKSQVNTFSMGHQQVSRSIVYFENEKAGVMTKFSKEHD